MRLVRRRLAACIVAALLLAPIAARAQGANPTPDADTAPSAGAASVATPEISQLTLDEIGRRAEDVAGQLRAMTEAISDHHKFTALEDEVFYYSHRISDRWTETDQMLAGPLRRAPLETLASSWRALRTELLDVRSDVDARAQKRESDLSALDHMKSGWAWTLEHARTVGAPPTVIERAQATVAAIDATRVQVDVRHKRMLVLQDAVSRSMQACDDALARIADARRRAVDRILSIRLPPIWKIGTGPPVAEAGPARLAQSSRDLSLAVSSVRIYTRTYRAGFVIMLVLGGLLAWVLYRARSRALQLTTRHAGLPEFVHHVFDTPISATVLLTLMLSRPLRPDPPVALQQLLLLIGIPAAIRILRRAVDRHLARIIYAIGVFYLVDIARTALRVNPGVEQVVLTVEMATAAALFLSAAAARTPSAVAVVANSMWTRMIGVRLFRAAGVATLFAAGAAALGYVELSDFVGGGALYLVYTAVAVLAFRVAGGGALWIALTETPLARLHAIEQNRARTERAINRSFEVVATGIWFVFALQRFELLGPAKVLFDSVLDAQLKVGELSFTLGRVIGFAAVVVIAWLTSRIVIFALEEDVYPRMQLARGVPYALSNLIRYGLLLAGFFAALATLGLDLTRLTVLVSAFGLGIGFGMQQIINNFVSGLILLFERPVQVGDLVQLKELNGEVLRIGIRSSRIRTSEGAEVIVPNSDVIQNRLTNWTLSDRRRRVNVDLGIAYGTDAERVIALLLAIAKADPRVMVDPVPSALFTGFGASALEFRLLFWTEESHWMTLKSDLCVALQHALRDAGISMPVTPVEVQIDAPIAKPGGAS